MIYRTVPEETPEVAELHRKIVSSETSLPQKHRVLFALRNIKGRAAHDAVASGELSRKVSEWTECTKYKKCFTVLIGSPKVIQMQFFTHTKSHWWLL